MLVQYGDLVKRYNPGTWAALSYGVNTSMWVSGATKVCMKNLVWYVLQALKRNVFVNPQRLVDMDSFGEQAPHGQRWTCNGKLVDTRSDFL